MEETGQASQECRFTVLRLQGDSLPSFNISKKLKLSQKKTAPGLQTFTLCKRNKDFK
jgi:hypothetical protein